YPRSALHEISHWCVAGASRRRLPDYGYWYAPEGRNQAQQAAFFAVEVKPQAIESLFCEALGMPFNVSIDNLDSPPSSEDVAAFHQRVIAQSTLFRCHGLPHRAEQFLARLQELKVEERVA
ncbi:MAG: elongation factor P hydroxylase, partial [Luminiphilus sp.]|nr:elongation factor P hydroxylase [Luminiphilus sp.]